MARQQNVTQFHSGGLGSQKAIAGSLDVQILAQSGLTAFFDFHPLRVIGGADITIINRKSGGANAVEVAAASGLTFGSVDTAPGGAIQRSGVFDGLTSLKVTNLFPVVAGTKFSQMIVFKAGREMASGINTLVRSLLVNGTGSSNINQLVLSGGNNIFGRVGSTGSFLDATTRFASENWIWALRTFDNASKLQRLVINGLPAITATGTTQTWVSPDMYIGGDSTQGEFVGKIGAVLAWIGGVGNAGDILDAGRAADYAVVKAYANALCGLQSYLAD